jgi:arylsulfatase A-like enzyme
VPVIIIIADGVRPDTLRAALPRTPERPPVAPAIARLSDEGAFFTVTSCFPTVTGPAYAPFLMGRYPGGIGLPGLRWFDRSRATCSFPTFARSYVGHQMRRVDRDLDPSAPTLFELSGRSVGALSVISRGLSPAGRVTTSAARVARTHFSGNVRGWLEIDRDIVEEVVRRVRDEQPEFVFAALTGIDKSSHAAGHESPIVGDAIGIVDELVARIRDDAERLGYWHNTHVWITSDHGHSPVLAHDDLARGIADFGLRVMSHPWIFTLAPQAAVMVSGNAMAHVYVELERRRRPFWNALETRWESLAASLLARPSVDLLLLPNGQLGCEVRSRDRGTAVVTAAGGRYSYRRTSGDPLGLGADLRRVDAEAAYEATLHTDYPDGLVQIATIASAPRAGDLILSAARDWDFRARYEPIPHVSSHGALHREHMLVPLVVNRPPAHVPRRTVDVMPSALAALGIDAPAGLDGTSFVAPRRKTRAA